jgi:hypothetical protein
VGRGGRRRRGSMARRHARRARPNAFGGSARLPLRRRRPPRHAPRGTAESWWGEGGRGMLAPRRGFGLPCRATHLARGLRGADRAVGGPRRHAPAARASCTSRTPYAASADCPPRAAHRAILRSVYTAKRTNPVGRFFAAATPRWSAGRAARSGSQAEAAQGVCDVHHTRAAGACSRGSPAPRSTPRSRERKTRRPPRRTALRTSATPVRPAPDPAAAAAPRRAPTRSPSPGSRFALLRPR